MMVKPPGPSVMLSKVKGLVLCSWRDYSVLEQRRHCWTAPWTHLLEPLSVTTLMMQESDVMILTSVLLTMVDVITHVLTSFLDMSVLVMMDMSWKTMAKPVVILMSVLLVMEDVIITV
jgi:hypothetical protein